MPLNTTLKKIPFALILQGMINILHGLGLRFLALGHNTPFMVRKWFCFHIDASSSASVFFFVIVTLLTFFSHLYTAHRHVSQLQKCQPGHPGSEGLWVRDLYGTHAQIYGPHHILFHWNWKCF